MKQNEALEQLLQIVDLNMSREVSVDALVFGLLLETFRGLNRGTFGEVVEEVQTIVASSRYEIEFSTDGYLRGYAAWTNNSVEESVAQLISGRYDGDNLWAFVRKVMEHLKDEGVELLQFRHPVRRTLRTFHVHKCDVKGLESDFGFLLSGEGRPLRQALANTIARSIGVGWVAKIFATSPHLRDEEFGAVFNRIDGAECVEQQLSFVCPITGRGYAYNWATLEPSDVIRLVERKDRHIYLDEWNCGRNVYIVDSVVPDGFAFPMIASHMKIKRLYD